MHGEFRAKIDNKLRSKIFTSDNPLIIIRDAFPGVKIPENLTYSNIRLTHDEVIVRFSDLPKEQWKRRKR